MVHLEITNNIGLLNNQNKIYICFEMSHMSHFFTYCDFHQKPILQLHEIPSMSLAATVYYLNLRLTMGRAINDKQQIIDYDSDYRIKALGK